MFIPSPSPESHWRRPTHAVPSLFAGLLLWLGICSDYQWSSTLANLAYPPLVGVAGWLLIRRCRYLPREVQRRRCRRCHLPAVLGGIPHALLLLLALCPTLWLGLLFALDEQANATIIQHEVSPDGWKSVEVHFFPVGAYSGGNGRIRVYLEYQGLSFIRREIYSRRVSYASEETENYLEWLDNDRIYVSEADAVVEPGLVRWQPPNFVVIIVQFVYVIMADLSTG